MRDQLIPLDENVFGSRLTEHGIQKKRKRVGDSRRAHYYTPIALRHALEFQGFETSAEADPGQEEQQQQPAAKTIITECPYCAVDNEAGNCPIFKSKSLREVQLHIIFKHPGQDFEE
jgi:hypothetical protein